MEAKAAAFTLRGFYFDDIKLKNFQIESEKLGLDFSPSGVFHKLDSSYTLRLAFKAIYTNEGKKDEVVCLTLYSKFVFTNVNDIDAIPSFFYRNAIAIVFPYIRSFVSSLTLQANSKVIVLPTMNLANLENFLKENTKLEN